MRPRTGNGHVLRHAAVAAAAAAGFLAVSACGTHGTPSSDAAPASSPAGERPAASSDFTRAYAAGYEQGKKLYHDGGKGVAVREVVWGGCARRALDAGARADQDRGAWVKGCQDGVSDTPRHPPAHPLTKRESNPRLLKDFRAWVKAEGDTATTRHARSVFTVELVGPDYDVEVSTDYSSRTKAEAFAGTFAQWWDADDGPGVARSLIILDAHDRRIVTKRL
uniref:hypothetical protein n=1 Tax=Streptomyces sp. NPDC048248 TaxID=3365523 RepID=UPI00371249C1